MKKALFLFVMATTLFVGCKKDDVPQEPEKKAKVEKPEEKKEVKTKLKLTANSYPSFDGKLYPSLIYSFANFENVSGEKMPIFTVNINSNKDLTVNLHIENDEFLNETKKEISLKKGDNKIEVNDLLWRYSDFRNIKKSGYTHFNFVIEDIDTSKELKNFSLKMEYRSINECVVGIVDDETKKRVFTSFLFASYVNEDSPIIDPFLSSVINNPNNNTARHLQYGWVGYQINGDYVDIQVASIIEELYRRGMRYSNITDSSNINGNGIASQYVRFIEESLILSQANCVDGSVLLASILTKIGIDCFLVTVPGHMYMGYYQDSNHENYTFVETTAISTGNWGYIYVDKSKDIENNIDNFENNENGYSFILIKNARKATIKPIQ